MLAPRLCHRIAACSAKQTEANASFLGSNETDITNCSMRGQLNDHPQDRSWQSEDRAVLLAIFTF